MMYYGLTRENQLHEMIADVCDLFPGSSWIDTVHLLTETCQQETQMGSYRDPSADGAGRGISQFDLIAVDDTIKRTKKHHQDIIDRFGVDLNQVEHNDLDFSPLVCVILMRLKYMLIPDAIPKSVEGRAGYWKVYYNTHLGKGEPREYIAASRSIRYIVSDALA